jgi:hypothetical protein
LLIHYGAPPITKLTFLLKDRYDLPAVAHRCPYAFTAKAYLAMPCPILGKV